MSGKNARLVLPNGKTYELPVVSGTLGPDCLDVRKLYAETGYFAFDPGYTSTASCDSSITFIDGDKGILSHRGYPIEYLAEHHNFLEVAHLLLHGNLPSSKSFAQFEDEIDHHSLLHEQLMHFYSGFRRSAHPMAIMMGVVGGLSAVYHEQLNINEPEERNLMCKRVIAKIPTIAAYAYKYSIGQPFVYPLNELSYVGNFLRMTFSVPSKAYVVDPILEKALEKIFILHADHEQNASTSTVRMAGSSGADPIACVASGIASLWGPAHGGANEAVLKMLDNIGSADKVSQFVKKAKDKNDPFKLMGFGHRVYKNYDPRAKIMQQTCYEVLDHLNVKDDRLQLAMKLEKVALEDEYFVERQLYPNVDFYSGIILDAMGFPMNMFTVLFALARTAGWVAHWKEMMEYPNQKISRPRQRYIGPEINKIGGNNAS